MFWSQHQVRGDAQTAHSPYSGDVGVYENLTMCSVPECSSHLLLLPFDSNDNFLINMLRHLMCTKLKKKKQPVWERRERHTKKQCRDTTEKNHWNTPQSLPGSVSRSNQNGFIKQFVHTRYELCGTKIKSEFFGIQIYAIVVLSKI